MLIRIDWVERRMLQENPDWYFLFGDNLQRIGYGGQAKECRGEPNAIGIPTKVYPSMHPDSFYSDKDFGIAKEAIDFAFSKIPPGATVVIPTNGIGTGLADLPNKAPKIYAYLLAKLKELE